VKYFLLGAIFIALLSAVGCADEQVSETECIGVIFQITHVNPTIQRSGGGFIWGDIELTVHNTTEYEVRILPGYEMAEKFNGRWRSGSGRMFDGIPMVLAPNEYSYAVFVDSSPPNPGEFRISVGIQINSGSKQTAYIYFAIPNADISVDFHGFASEMYSTTPTSVTFYATNGFLYGNIHLSGHYQIQRVDGVVAENLPHITAIGVFDPRDYQTQIISPRQIQRVTVHWGWLYGQLPPGEYVMRKYIQHEGGEQKEVSVYFTVKEERYTANPTPNMFVFEEATSVVEVVRHEYFEQHWGQMVLTVGTGWEGQRRVFFGEPAGAVLDVYGIPMRFADIPVGAIIEIVHGGLFFSSSPEIAAYVIQIRILE